CACCGDAQVPPRPTRRSGGIAGPVGHPAPTYLQPHDLLRCKACLRAGSLSKNRLAVHLGLPTMERKMLPKCSPRYLVSGYRPFCPHLTQHVPKTQENQSNSDDDGPKF